MNVDSVFGKKTKVKVLFPNGDISDDENLSDDEDFRKENEFGYTLAKESAYSDDERDVDNGDVISETDSWDSEDDLPLANFARKLPAHKKKEQKLTLQWEEKHLTVSSQNIAFMGSESLPSNLDNIDDTDLFDIFKYLFTDDILTYITDQTNLYSVQIRPEKPADITKAEINAFIGICMFMSVVQLPTTRSYWNNSLGIPAVAQTMTCNRFEEIKRFLHFSNNNDQKPRGHPEYDSLFKIRPFLTMVREKMLLIPKEEFLAVDEQIIPTKARSHLKQYNPKKPHKWGYKVYVLSGVSGFSYDFDIFDGTHKPLPNRPDLGASSNVVVKLTDTVPKHQNFKVFFDNWFTSLPLLTYLHKEGILPLGTVRMNRLPNCQLPKDSDMKKLGRGAFLEKVAKVDGVDVSVVAWYDNKMVTTVSTYVGSQPTDEVRRFCRKTKTHITVPRPYSIAVYNAYMGGVDLLDSMLGYYRIRIRSKKWYLRIFFHFLDMIAVNAWILWRRKAKNSDVYLPLSEFKLMLAEVLTSSNTENRKRGRPSGSLQPKLDLKKKKYPFSKLPAQEVRRDKQNHLPLWKEDRQRCKYPECTGKSFLFCEKCNVHLCLNKDRNCFYKFHTE